MKNITIKTVFVSVFLVAPLLVSAQTVNSAVGGAGYACPALARICPDGTTASPQGPNCTITCHGVAASTSITSIIPVPVAHACVNITRSIGEGAWGDDVRGLQAYLSSLGLFTASQTGKYGPLTRSAVMQWQSAQGVASTGVVGPLTRAQLMLRTCNASSSIIATSTATTSVKIVSMMPNAGRVGSSVTLVGIGFTGDNTVRFGESIIPHISATSSSTLDCPGSNDSSCAPGVRKSLSFTIPSMTTPACIYANPRCMIAQALIAPGVYKVGVQNENGTSRFFDYTVTAQ